MCLQYSKQEEWNETMETENKCERSDFNNDDDKLASNLSCLSLQNHSFRNKAKTKVV